MGGTVASGWSSAKSESGPGLYLLTGASVVEKARHEEMFPHEIVARSDRFPILLAAYSDPPLTTILYPMREVGALGTRLLIELMEDAEAQEPGSGSQHLPGGPEVVRGSEENEGLTDLWG